MCVHECLCTHVIERACMFVCVCVCVCVCECKINCRLGGATHCVWGAIRGAMKLMTCCSCDRPPGPRILSGGARGSAAADTKTQGLSLFREVGLVPDTLSTLPPTSIHLPPPPPTPPPLLTLKTHTHTHGHTLSPTHTRDHYALTWRQ